MRRMEQKQKRKLIQQIMEPVENQAMGRMLGLMVYGQKTGRKLAELAPLIRTDGPRRKFMDNMFTKERCAGPAPR